MIKLIWVVGYNAWLLGSLWLTGATILNFARGLMAANEAWPHEKEQFALRKAAWAGLLPGIGFAIAWPLALLYRFTRTQLTNQVKDM